MPAFTTVATNGVSPAETFAFILDVSKWPLFEGFGPLPAIVEAEVPGGEVKLGSRIRVRNSDGSVHHEVVTVFEPGRRYGVEMEVVRPASFLMRTILEDVQLAPAGEGTHITRRFTTVPVGWWTAPLVWCITWLLLRPAVKAHDRAVQRLLAG